MISIGGNRAVNIAASLVTVQKYGKVWPYAKVDRLLIYNLLHTILLDSLSPSRGSLENVLSCTTRTK